MQAGCQLVRVANRDKACPKPFSQALEVQALTVLAFAAMGRDSIAIRYQCAERVDFMHAGRMALDVDQINRRKWRAFAAASGQLAGFLDHRLDEQLNSSVLQQRRVGSADAGHDGRHIC